MTLGRIFTMTMNIVFKRFLVSIVRSSLIYFIALLLVYLPTLWHFIITLGKDDYKSKKQNRIRAKLTDELDSSSAYRAVEVIDGLQNQLEDNIETLADIPEHCLQRYANKQTMGIREILNVEDEKQPNGKIFKKVCLCNFYFNQQQQQKKKYILICFIEVYFG